MEKVKMIMKLDYPRIDEIVVEGTVVPKIGEEICVPLPKGEKKRIFEVKNVTYNLTGGASRSKKTRIKEVEIFLVRTLLFC